MILQALCDYYDRKRDDLPELGFEKRAIPFVIVINEKGEFISLEDRREKNGKKIEVQLFTVPQLPKARKATEEVVESGETAGIAWDKLGYVLGQPNLDKKTKTYLEKDIRLAQSQFIGFKKKIKRLCLEIVDDIGLNAVNLFYENESNIDFIIKSEVWDELIKKDSVYMAFKLIQGTHLVCQSAEIISYVSNNSNLSVDGVCLVSGENDEIARTHSTVNILGGTNPKLVSFNKPSFESFGKSQSFNSPIGARTSFKYATALNYMLRSNSLTKFQISDTFYVCWAGKDNQLESAFASIFTDAKDDPDSTARVVKGLFSTIHNGAYLESDGKNKFFVLGLAPNNARIVVRYWRAGTIAEFSEKIAQWFNDVDIDGRDHYGYPVLKKLLRSTALQYKDDNISPNLPAEVIRSILTGTCLPETFIQATLRRIKSEKNKDKSKFFRKGEINYLRVCIVKAYLNRKYRFSTTNQRELTVSLNKEEKRIGYCLGRLFAVLEKLQQDAHKGKEGKATINATIRDRYYSSASSTPKTVFGTLMRLSTHHIKKLEKPEYQISVEKRIGEVMDCIPEFPSHLNLENQGLFAIGYYHQKQDFYTKDLDKGE